MWPYYVIILLCSLWMLYSHRHSVLLKKKSKSETLMMYSQAINQERRRIQELRRQMLYVITAFLQEHGYSNAAESLFKEAQLSRDIHVCDNIDLETIILEYSDYYYAKCNRYPKLCKKSEAAKNVTQNTSDKGEKVLRASNSKQGDGRADECTNKSKIVQKSYSDDTLNDQNLSDICLKVTPIFPAESGEHAAGGSVSTMFDQTFADNKSALKPISDLYPSDSEFRQIAEVISREVVQHDLNVHWDDIKGLDHCKTLLKEAVVYPLKYKELFKGKFNSSRGVLLYGPPGTGKTMLAKAVATECQSTFFNITSSSIISKWRGDSEKHIRVLIDLAKQNAPSIIFIDEIDWTATKFTDSLSYSEPARRFRSELLARLDGLLSMECAHVTLLVTTNVPWDIDIALSRRLEKKIFVTLPDQNIRRKILESYIRSDLHHSTEMSNLITYTNNNYSCADIKLLCTEAWLNQLRPFWNKLETNEISISNVPNDDLICAMSYFEDAKAYVKPIDHVTYEKYKNWNIKHDFNKVHY